MRLSVSARATSTFGTRTKCEKSSKHRPDWIVLPAAYTNVDDCESHPDLAFAVNRDGAVNVADAAKQTGSKLLFLSSDYVFDGKKTSPYETGAPGIRRAFTDGQRPRRKSGCSKVARVLHRANFLAVWYWGKCFPIPF